MNTNDLLTTTEAARLVRRSPETLIRWILHGGLPAVRVKGRYLIARRDLLARMETVNRPGAVPAALQPEWVNEVLRRHGLA